MMVAALKMREELQASGKGAEGTAKMKKKVKYRFPKIFDISQGKIIFGLSLPEALLFSYFVFIKINKKLLILFDVRQR